MTRALIVASLVALSQAAPAQILSIRPLGPIASTSRETIGDLAGVRVLSDGRVLVNDRGKKRVILLDSSLSRFDAVLDVTAVGPAAYPSKGALIIAGVGDTTFVLDFGAGSLIIVDSLGRLGRSIAMPRMHDANYMFMAGFGQPIVDAAGYMVYRTFGYSAAGEKIDSDPVVRVDFVTRRVDTLGHLAIPPYLQAHVVEDSTGRQVQVMRVRPFLAGDDWAAFPNGTVAIVRSRDYHIDWIEPDGKTRSTAPAKWNWVRLSDDDKSRIVDSVNSALARSDSIANGQVVAGPGAATQSAGGVGGVTAKFGGGGMMKQTRSVEPSELPDYPPPFLRATRVDPPGRLWVTERPTNENAGGLVYDIIDHTGQIVDRVQAPAGYSVVGFGPGGIVYLAGGPRAIVRIAKASITRRP